MALLYSFAQIISTQTAANAVINELLMEAMRQDLYNLEARLGRSTNHNGEGAPPYSAVENHNHDGNNSALAPGKNYVSGDYVIINNPKEKVNAVTGSYSPMKEILVKKAGTIQCQWEVRYSDESAGTVRTQIWIDGASVDAGENLTSSGSYVTKSLANIAVAAGDLIELRGKPDVSMDVRNFEIAVNVATVFSEGYHKDK